MTLRWLYPAVLGPLVLLSVLAWWGTRAQLKAAWAEAREEAERVAPAIARTLAEDLEAAAKRLPEYPLPPVPGTASSADTILDGTDLAALARLRDDPEAGPSPAGLPRRALAAMRIHQLAPKAQSTGELVELLTRTAPSVLTSPVLRELPGQAGLADWQLAEGARQAARDLEPGQSRWLPAGGFVHRSQNGLVYLCDRQIQAKLRALGSATAFTPVLLHPGAEPASDLLVTTALSFPGNGTRLALHTPAGLIEAPVRRQQGWTFALLAVAILTAGLALFSLHRAVARERRLADLKTQFVSSVSHELRAPLGSIRLMAEALQENSVPRPAEFHSLIAREGGRLSHLIENVLDFARIEDGRKRYHFEESDVSALIHATLELMQPPAAQREIRFEIELEDVTATLDPGAIQQALVNLLDNALKYSPEGAVVRVTASQVRRGDSELLEIRVSDEGPGIPEKDRGVIFERFHRLGNELRRETPGTGIGLSIVRHIARGHGGSVAVSDGTPCGTCFTLTLPIERCDS